MDRTWGPNRRGRRLIESCAFPSDAEARLVDALLGAGRLALSLVAVDGDQVAGHLAFSPVSGGGLGLAPIAVRPEFQRRGIGSGLIRESLRQAESVGTAFVIVLGEPNYYAHFGFSPASRWGMIDEYGGGDAFQVIVWGTPPAHGAVRYSPEFAMFGRVLEVGE